MNQDTLTGHAITVGDDVSTDDIIPGRFASLRSNLPELAKHTFEDRVPGFSDRVKAGDVLVGGRNFGLGSSREHAPVVIKMSGVAAVLAKSVARIFYRNAINQGLVVLICDTDGIRDGDELELRLGEGIVVNHRTGARLSCGRIPPLMSRILAAGGLIPYIKEHGSLDADA
ncbi:MAG: 3-isopropylmalate dehydratase [Dehalococcoidia bacterium]|nr:MAG: 3-isopropylmalate dehydratase [Dehalococcoidia bacterium]